MSSGAVVGLAGSVEVLLAVPPAALSVSQLQGAIREVSALGDRLGGWLDSALGELAARAAGQVPAACGDGRQVPLRAWLREATLCGGTAAGASVRLAERAA